MTALPAEPLSFEEFRRLLAAELQLDIEQVVPEASLVEDLLVDSIRMVDLMLRFEEMGVCIPIEEAWTITTVEDAFNCYVRAVTSHGKDLASGAAARASTT